MLKITFPSRSPFEKGWYGMFLNWSGISHGPHPVALSWMTGALNLATTSSGASVAISAGSAISANYSAKTKVVGKLTSDENTFSQHAGNHNGRCRWGVLPPSA